MTAVYHAKSIRRTRQLSNAIQEAFHLQVAEVSLVEQEVERLSRRFERFVVRPSRGENEQLPHVLEHVVEV